MKIGVLYSGGKDSTLALLKAGERHKIACLITLLSENPESYMFQTANVWMTKLQAEAMNLPLVSIKTKGEKEAELEDLKRAILEAKNKYHIEGVVTGALRSTYQASRIQKICHDLDLWCFNPLWLKDPVELLNEALARGIRAIISGVFAEPLDESYLGKTIDQSMIEKLASLKNLINPAGEGGELETTVIKAPTFNKKIIIDKAEITHAKHSGIYSVKEAHLE